MEKEKRRKSERDGGGDGEASKGSLEKQGTRVH